MIAGYLRPQLFIREVLQVLPNVDALSLHAFVFGPQFALFRYTNATERAAKTGTAFVQNTSNVLANRQVLPYEGFTANLIVDQAFVKVYAENIEAELFSAVSGTATTLGNTYTFSLPSLQNPNQLVVRSVGANVTVHKNATAVGGTYQMATVTINSGGTGYAPSSTVFSPVIDNTDGGTGAYIRLTTNSSGVVTSGVVVSPGSGYLTDLTFTIPGPTVNIGVDDDTLIPELQGRQVQAGDVLYASFGGTTVRRLVQSVAQQLQPATVGVSNNRQFVASPYNPVETDAASFTNTTAPYGWSIGLTGGHVASDWNGLLQGSYYQNKYGESYTILCTQTGTTTAQFRIRSSSGAFSADNVLPATYALVSGVTTYTLNDASLGGLNITLTGGAQPIQVGQQFSFAVFGKYLPLQLAPTGQVTSVSILAGGAGYTNGAAVTFSAPPTGGTQATGVLVVSAGVVTGVAITNPGAGYLKAPLVTQGGGAGAVFQANIATSNNSCDLAILDGTSYNGPVNNRYVVSVVQGGAASFNGAILKVQDTAGVDVSSQITLTEGNVYNLGSYGLQFTLPSGLVAPQGAYPGVTATATLTVTSGAITAVTVTNGGSGYTVPPTLVISSSAGNSAVLYPVVNNGVIEDIVVVTGGSGYLGGDTVAIAAPTLYQAGLRTGDQYYIDVTAPAVGGAYNTVTLAGAITDITGWAPTDVGINLFNVDFRLLYSGLIPAQGDPGDAPTLSWVASQSGVTIKNNLKINVPSRNTGFQWPLVQNSAYGRLFVHWRGLVPSTGSNSSAGSPTRYYSDAAIIAKFGVNDIDNPLCYAACIAFNGAQGKSIFVASVPTNDLAGYTSVLNQASRIQGPYSLVPTTYDQAVQDLVKVHVDTCSLYNVKLWRRAYIGTPSAGEFVVANSDANNNPLLGTVLNNGNGNLRVVSANAQFIVEEVQGGDMLRTNFTSDPWGNQSYVEYPILSVLENNELILASGPSAPITVASRFEIWRPDTGTNQAGHIGALAAAVNDRRICHVWTDSPTILDSNGDYVVTPLWNLAAEIAGLRSALLPQQGLTYTELQYSIAAAPLMYTKYLDLDLDIAAANGVMIVTQETAGGPIFIRHQLTTQTGEGSLYYEDSVGTNFDNIAYTFKGILQPYIGKRNATPAVVEELDMTAKTTLDDFKRSPAPSISNIGPAVVDWNDLSVMIDPTFRDRIIMGATVQLPLPIGVVDMTLTGTTITGDVVITTSVSTPVPAT